ncbi:FAD-dependent thymidylate synthase [Bradyrhizobium sp. S3.5.5]|uniref:FAD-dependent thymidylate synthase n=1 Tax=Bradyrhizobium sp. S3.5.5 TaxID=3156430 RepID=UPI0033936930
MFSGAFGDTTYIIGDRPLTGQAAMSSTTKQSTPIVALERPSVPAIDDILGQEIPVLDSGFVRVIDYMGNDDAVVQAARVSYGTGTKSVREDAGLISYLMRHLHTTPFEMCEIKLHVKLPIFVARQWIRHRTANVNEYSARYSILDREFYVPSPDHLNVQSTSNRQGRGARIPEDEARKILDIIRDDSGRSYDRYMELLNEGADGRPTDPDRSGLSRELARMNLTLNFYTQWYWKIDLHNLLHFLQLRADPHAQYEIRAYADAILGIVQTWVPKTYAAFLDHRLNSVRFSGSAMVVIRRLLRGEKVTQENSGLSKREWDELQIALAPDRD